MAHPQPTGNVGEPSDARLVSDAARGSADALATLYSRYAKQLLAIAYRLLQSRQDAEDVVHDVFVGLPEALRRYEERGSLGSWLRKITARLSLMRLREESTRPAVELDERTLRVSGRVSANPPETALTIEQALRALSPNLRAVLVLKEIEGFTHAEIAAMLDISVGASEVRLHRALLAMRAQLIDNT